MASASQVGSGIYRSPLDVVRSGWRHRHLILRLTRREIEARYRGSLLGIAWAALVPLLLLAVYTFVFSVVFQARWNTGDGDAMPEGGRAAFALILFSGLVVFNLFAECVNRAPSLIRNTPTYVTKVVFPLECLPWVALGASAFNALVSAGVLLVGYLFVFGVPPLAIVSIPIVLVPMLLLTLGLTWLLASLGVYMRDLEQFVPIVTTILMFMSPIFYPMEQLPAKIIPIFRLNPLAATVEATRGALFRGDWPSWSLLLVQVAFAWVIAWLGYMWFAKTRKGFADVL